MNKSLNTDNTNGLHFISLRLDDNSISKNSTTIQLVAIKFSSTVFPNKTETDVEKASYMIANISEAKRSYVLSYTIDIHLFNHSNPFIMNFSVRSRTKQSLTNRILSVLMISFVG